MKRYQKCFFIPVLFILFTLGSAVSVNSDRADKRCSFWLDLYRGEPITFEQLLDDLAVVQLIFLGEFHTIERHHNIQLKVLEALCRRKKVILALEQMEAHYQDALDRYARGEIGFVELADRTDWVKRWNNYRDYRKLLLTARKNGSPIIALNAKSEIIRRVAMGGLASLSADERSQLPASIQLDDPLYEKLLGKILYVHRFVGKKNIRSIYEAQVSRDEMMAEVIARHLKERGKSHSIVVIGGSQHFAHGLGVPNRVRRRVPDVRDRIVLLSESGDLHLSEHEKRVSRSVSITHQDLRFLKMPLADYLYVTEPL